MQSFSGIFWVLPINRSLYEKAILGIFVYLFICRVKTKVNFRFYKQCNQGATCLICKRAIFAQNASIVFSSNIPLYIEKLPWKNYVRF